jgi:hypothetical protein
MWNKVLRYLGTHAYLFIMDLQFDTTAMPNLVIGKKSFMFLRVAR